MPCLDEIITFVVALVRLAVCLITGLASLITWPLKKVESWLAKEK